MDDKKRKEFEIDPNQFTQNDKRKVIKGGCGICIFVTKTGTTEEYVCKRTIRKLKIEDGKKNLDFILFDQEVDVLAQYHHPAIVPFIGYAIDQKHYGNIFLKFIENGSLDTYIKSVHKYPQNNLLDNTNKLIISYGIARAMEFLHSHEILHRDLKSENVLLDKELRPYITDFGTSKAINAAHTSQTVQQTTTRIMPPEYITDYDKFNRTPPIDVYSYAMILYELWTERPPYSEKDTISTIITKTLANDRPKFSSPGPSENWQRLITQCWDEKPENRPTFSDIVELLESEHFITSNIDKQRFESYKQMVDSGSSSNPQPIQNLQPELEIENLTESNKVESRSKFGQELIIQGDIDEGIDRLSQPIQKGSISAMITFGNACASDSKYGNKDIFYNMAANCCHCLDEVGFNSQVDYKVYRCENCNLEICEGCAKCCHKDHQIVEIGTKQTFVCGCGRNHFTEKNGNRHCSVEYVGEMKYEGQPYLHQHFYQCKDCCQDQNKYICRGCAESCHKGHNLVDCGIQKGFCSCGMGQLDNGHNCKCVCFLGTPPDQCTCQKYHNNVVQRWFQCVTCGICKSENDGICQSCANKCHAGHLILDRGVQKHKCRCMLEKKCSLKK